MRTLQGSPYLQSAVLLCTLYPMEIQRITDSPFLWGAAGLIVGVALGVTTVSAWIMAIGLGAHLLYLRFRGPAQHGSEGMLFASGPAFMMGLAAGLRRARTD